MPYNLSPTSMDSGGQHERSETPPTGAFSLVLGARREFCDGFLGGSLKQMFQECILDVRLSRAPVSQ